MIAAKREQRCNTGFNFVTRSREREIEKTDEQHRAKVGRRGPPTRGEPD